MSFSFANSRSLLHSKQRKSFNMYGATSREIGKHTKGSMSKVSSTCVHLIHSKEQVFNINMATQFSKFPSCVETKHWKEQVFIIFVATQNHLITKIKESLILSTCLQENHKKEQLFHMFGAKHGKGIRAGFDLELTSIMLSRALFVNSCSIEVDIVVRVPTHMLAKENKVCAWYMNASSIMMRNFLCTSPLALIILSQ